MQQVGVMRAVSDVARGAAPVLLGVLLLAVAYIPMLTRYPVPFEQGALWVNTHFLALSLRATYLRFPHDLPGLAMPRTSERINGRDYVYTSQNNLLFIATTVTASLFTPFVNLLDPFRFVVFSRAFAVVLNLCGIVAFYGMFRIFYGDRFRAAVVALMVGGGGALYFTADTVRWLLVTNFVVPLTCCAYIASVRTGRRSWRALTCGLLVGLGALDYISGLFALGIGLGVWVRERRTWPPAPTVAAGVGVAMLLGSVIVGEYHYGQVASASTGVGAMRHLLENSPRLFARSLLTSIGLDAFYPPMHAWIPLLLSDVTAVLVPPLPHGMRALFDIPLPEGVPFTALGLVERMLGVEPMWWSSTRLWRSWLLAAGGVVIQLAALAVIAIWWFGVNVRILSPRVLISGTVGFLRAALSKSGERQILYQVALCNVAIYVFLIYEVSVEGVFRAGVLSLAVGIASAELLSRVALTRWAKVRLVGYVVVLLSLSVWHAVETKVFEPRAHRYYAPYVALVEWGRGASRGQPLYFDFPFDHLPAKLLIDGPMPYGCLAVPQIADRRNCRNFQTVYGDSGQRVLILGIGKVRRDQAAANGSVLQRGDVIRWAELRHEELHTSLRGFLPERPDVRIRLDYLERITLGAEDDVYFYGGVIVPEGLTGA